MHQFGDARLLLGSSTCSTCVARQPVSPDRAEVSSAYYMLLKSHCPLCVPTVSAVVQQRLFLTQWTGPLGLGKTDKTFTLAFDQLYHSLTTVITHHCQWSDRPIKCSDCSCGTRHNQFFGLPDSKKQKRRDSRQARLLEAKNCTKKVQYWRTSISRI